MIFNLSHGGLANISVTAPTGSVITASCEGLTVTGTGTCVLDAPIIGTWHVVCVFDNTEKSSDVVVASYGQTYSVVFDYAAKIVITTFPLASVTATKTGQTTLTGTADSDGLCELSVPEGGLGEWSVTSNNGSVSETGAVNVVSYDTSYPVSLLTLVPDITVVIGDDTYNYKGAEITNSDLTISPVGVTGWKLLMRTSGTIKFNRLPTNVDVCVVGKGTAGGYYRYISPNDYGGGAGTGGQVVNKMNQSLTVGTVFSVTVDSSGTSFSDIASAGIGGGSAGGGGASTIDTGWSSPTHPQYSYSGPGSGYAGKYAFDDQSFDGVEYGHGGEGGDTNWGGGSRGSTTGVYANPGAGGAGGGQSNNVPTDGRIGILIMRNAA